MSSSQWQSDRRILELSAFQQFLCSCFIAEISVLPVQFFRFVSVHLSSAKPITWGGHRVWEDDIISVNFIHSLTCCQWTLRALNSYFRGPSLSSSITLHSPLLSFSGGFSHLKKWQKVFLCSCLSHSAGHYGFAWAVKLRLKFRSKTDLMG